MSGKYDMTSNLSYSRVMMFMAAVFLALNILDIFETEYVFNHYPGLFYETNPNYYTWGKWVLYAVKILAGLLVAGASYMAIWLVGLYDARAKDGFSFWSTTFKAVSLYIMARNVVFIGFAVLNNTFLALQALPGFN